MKTIILVGAGHAHLEIIKALSIDEIQKNKFILVSPARETFYSGLIPRMISGDVEPQGLTVQSFDYAKSKGFEIVSGRAKHVDFNRNQLILEDSRVFVFDILSLNIGGNPQQIPTRAPFSTIYLRPFDEFLERWREVKRICSACMSPVFIVVGGGPAAVEVAASLKVRLNRNQASQAQVHIVTRGSRLCENYSEAISNGIQRSIEKLDIKVHLREDVKIIFEKHIEFKDGSHFEFDCIFVTTPVKPTDFLFSPEDLPRSEQGFLLIDSKLRLRSNIFAAGDFVSSKTDVCAPKSGVTAVRQGRHLVQSLRNAIIEIDPPEFVRPVNQLNILITGSQIARAIWGDFSIEGKIILKIKNWIDKRYMDSFRI